MDEIRIAVVGLGSRGVNGWIPLLQRIEGFRITAICDPILPLQHRALSRLENPGAVTVYDRYEDVLDAPDVDAIGLTVRCQQQGLLAAQGLEAGKHVNAEVPAAHRLEDCWRIVVAQERTGLVYQLAEQCRYAGYIEAWRKLVSEGKLGKITYCEGQYFHYYVNQSFCNPATGMFYRPDEAKSHQDAQPTWMYHMPPIHYLPHDLSPLLKVLDDRVVEVVAMSTDTPSMAHSELAVPDMQVALMKTEKGALMRMAASFSQPHPHEELHWQQIIGTQGAVEWRRAANDHPKMWLMDSQMSGKVDMVWGYGRDDAPPEARDSGHSDMDYYVHAAFRNAVLGREPLEFDVYRAMDTAAPAILAAESIQRGSQPMRVPSFRPSEARQVGEMPQASHSEHKS